MNRSLHLAIALSLAGVLGLANAQSGTSRPPPADIPPPPGLDDPGVDTAAATAQEDTAHGTDAPAADEDPLAPLPRPDARLVRDKASRAATADRERMAASELTTRQEGTDTIEEYRQNGRLWMVRIVPADGPEQTFYAADPSGKLVRDPNMGPVAPVYYTLYEWK